MEYSGKQKWSMRRATARLNLWEGAVRASKTVATIGKFIKLLPLASKDGDIFLIGKTIDSLKRNIIIPLQLLLGNDCQYYPGKRECHIWGRVCYTVGANDERAEGKIRGSTSSLVLGDEVTLWAESFFKMLDSRLSLDNSIFLGTTNADNPNHYLKRDYLDRIQQLDMRSFHFKLEDNPFLSQKFIDAIKKNYTGLWYKRFILGLWCLAEGAIFDFFDEEENTLSRTPPADFYDIGIDYGTGNPTTYILMGNSLTAKKPYIWAEREYFYDSRVHQRQKTDLEYANDLYFFVGKYSNAIDSLIERKFGMERLLEVKRDRICQIPLHDTFIDPSAASFSVQLKRDGFPGIKDADNDVLPGIRTVSRMLKSRDYAICQECTNYIKEFYGYHWDSKQQAVGVDAPKKESNHCQDAGRYVVYTKYGKQKIDYSIFTKM